MNQTKTGEVTGRRKIREEINKLKSWRNTVKVTKST